MPFLITCIYKLNQQIQWDTLKDFKNAKNDFFWTQNIFSLL